MCSKWDTMCSESKTRWRDKEFIRDYIRADDGKYDPALMLFLFSSCPLFPMRLLLFIFTYLYPRFYMCFEDFVRYFNGLYVLHQIEPVSYWRATKECVLILSFFLFFCFSFLYSSFLLFSGSLSLLNRK